MTDYTWPNIFFSDSFPEEFNALAAYLQTIGRRQGFAARRGLREMIFPLRSLRLCESLLKNFSQRRRDRRETRSAQ